MIDFLCNNNWTKIRFPGEIHQHSLNGWVLCFVDAPERIAAIRNIMMRPGGRRGQQRQDKSALDKYKLTPGTGGTYRNYYSIINNVVINIRINITYMIQDQHDQHFNWFPSWNWWKVNRKFEKLSWLLYDESRVRKWWYSVGNPAIMIITN